MIGEGEEILGGWRGEKTMSKMGWGWMAEADAIESGQR